MVNFILQMLLIPKRFYASFNPYLHLSKKQNLCDNMTNLELVLNMLAEASTTAISKKKQPKGLPANRQVARQGGVAAGKARAEIEKHTGESVITGASARYLPRDLPHRVRSQAREKKVRATH